MLVIGGSASGKSEYAERRAAALPAPRIYLATMEDDSAEGREKIRKHREHRSGRGFFTLERPRGLAELIAEESERDRGEGLRWERAEKERRPPLGESAVLLECLSNLAANEMFLPGGSARGEKACAEITAGGVLALREACRKLIVVGNILTEEEGGYDSLTASWLRAFSAAQAEIAAAADEVWRVEAGLSLRLK